MGLSRGRRGMLLTGYRHMNYLIFGWSLIISISAVLDGE